jgi:O-antigen ligase
MEPARTSIEALSRLGFLALVFSLAFMKPSLAFAGQRIAPTDLLFPFTAILFLAACVFTKRQFEWKPVYWLFFAYFAAMAISTIFSPNTTASVSKLAGIGYLLGLAVIACESIRNENDVRLTIYAWLAGLSISVIIGTATAVSFYSFDNSLLQPFTYHQGAAPAGAYRRISSTFISPAMFCNYLNVGLFLAFIARTKGWLADKFVLPLIIAIVLCSLLTVTIGIGVVILSGGIILWLTFRREQPLAARVSLVTGSLALIPFAASAFFALQPHKTAPYSFQIPFFGYEVFPSPRLLVWQQAFQTFLADPLTGIGTGMPVARVAFQNADGSMSLLTDAHNFLLNIAAQAGIFGLIALTAIFVYVVRLGFSKRNTENAGLIRLGLGVAFFAAFGIQGLTGSFEDARHLWVLIGMIIAVDRIGKEIN